MTPPTPVEDLIFNTEVSRTVLLRGPRSHRVRCSPRFGILHFVSEPGVVRHWQTCRELSLTPVVYPMPDPFWVPLADASFTIMPERSRHR